MLAVLAYHLWPDRLPAGFLGVTVFFVLSGFLITRLLLAEHAATATIALGSFWTRRGRRLLPASLVTLAVVATVWMVQGWLTRAFSADIVWSLADLANWHTLASGATYGAAGIDSPVLHFWSLAIEEQCYLVLPLVVWAVLRWRGWSTRALGWVVGLMLLASLAYTAANHGDANLVYLSTFSRAAELLAGVLLAVVVARRGGLPTGPTWRVLSVVAGAALVAAMARTSIDDPIYAMGGLALAAALTVVVVLGATGGGVLERALSMEPLRAIGRISYAVYLFHWPILMAFREAGTDAWYVAPVTIAATFALAALSMVVLEAPIRNRRWVVAAPRMLVLPAVATIIAVCVFGVAPASTDLDFAAAQAQFDALGSGSLDGATGAPASLLSFGWSDPGAAVTVPPAGLGPVSAATKATGTRPTAMVFGDSTALMLGVGLIYTDQAIGVPGFANVGCPLTRGGSFRLSFDDHSGKVFDANEGCDWTTKLPDLAARSHPDLALFSGGMIDTVPRKLHALGPGWHTLEEPGFRAVLRSELEAAVDAVEGASPHTKVVLVTISPDWKRGNDTHRARVDIVNQVIEEVAADRPGMTEVVDLKGWIDATGERERLCPDGMHLVPATTAKEVYERFLGPRLRQIASGDITARH